MLHRNAVAYLFNIYKAYRLKNRNPQDIFTYIFLINGFVGKDSVSGSGSDLVQTKEIIRTLPHLFREYNLRTVLDIPCGDFYWMKESDLRGMDYWGADIVKELIVKNVNEHERKNIHFIQRNILCDPLPDADLIINRDCLVHLSVRDILLATQNMCRSKSKYLLTTTFPSRPSNRDILTGQWRPLNLEAEPLNFPPPLQMINEGCTEDNGNFRDKSLGLWRIDDLRKLLHRYRRLRLWAEANLFKTAFRTVMARK